jgi:hypothetical protein
MKAQYLESAALELGEAGGWLWREEEEKRKEWSSKIVGLFNRSKP